MPYAAYRSKLSNRLILLALCLLFYGTFALFTPPLLDDADSVHAEVAREMLARHDFVTLYPNGIGYLEKAPLYYWMMAAAMKLFGPTTAASRLPLFLSVAGLALLMESFGRRGFASARAGLYAGLITLSSFGIFIFSRLNIPDLLVCLLLGAAMYLYWLTSSVPPSSQPDRDEWVNPKICYAFAAVLALTLLTKGLIGVVFPVGIVGMHLLLTRGWRGTFHRIGQLHPVASTLVLLVIAAPWHILVALANPGHGAPGDLARVGGHWQVPLPTDGNVHGWTWFYFMNEQVYRYLNVRVPHDYDTSPLWLFYGLILIWLMPWSAFLYPAIRQAMPRWRGLRSLTVVESTHLLLLLWAAVPLLFFSLSTRQEYYVLPSLPPLILLIARLLAGPGSEAAETVEAGPGGVPQRLKPRSFLETYGTAEAVPLTEPAFSAASQPLPLTEAAFSAASQALPLTRPPFFSSLLRTGASLGVERISFILMVLGTLLSLALAVFLLKTKAPLPSTDLASLLQQNPGDYALSFGHFLDLNAQALGMFRLPLALTCVAVFAGPFANWYLRRKNNPHAATLALAAAAFVFLFAAHQGLRVFSPTLTSKQLADAIQPQLRPGDMVAIHGEYEAGSTLGFYLRRNDLHIVEGRSSNLWYGSFFPDAPRIFETRDSIARKWRGPGRIFLWEDPHDPDRPVLPLSPVYVVASGGGKSILSNQPNR